MICPYCEIGNYFGTCKCKVADTPCPFMRRCSMEHKWLPLQGMNTCTRQTKEREVSMLMANEHIVEFESKGKLYINIGGQIERISNPFDYTPKKVEIIFVDNKPYIKGYEPKVQKKETVKEDVDIKLEENKELAVEKKDKKRVNKKKGK